jgi:hypothetical protein
MAYKIFTGAKPFLKADIRPFNVTEMRMLTLAFYYLAKNITIKENSSRLRSPHPHE